MEQRILRPRLLRAALAAASGLALLAMGGAVVPAAAQDGADNNRRTTDVITVTARKREESALDVPISVTAVSGAQLDALGVTNFETVAMPGVSFARGGMADAPSIRGIGSGDNLGFEQSAPIYIDGVYYGRGRILRYGFTDLEAVEVLKGPQPIYYGKNAIAGAIGLRTRRPTDEFEAGLNAFHEFNHDEYTVDGFVSGPIAEGVRGRIAAKYRSMDGYLFNRTTGNTEPNSQDFVGRGHLEFDLAENLTVLATGYGGFNEDDGRNNQMYICSAAFFTEFGNPANEDCVFDRFKAQFADNPGAPATGRTGFGDSNAFFSRLEFYGGNLNAQWGLTENISLTSVTAYYAFTNDQAADPDNGDANALTANFSEDFSQFSQEVRLSGDHDRFDWLAGFYYDTNSNNVDQAAARNRAGANPGSMFGAAMGGMGDGFLRQNREDADSWAIFGEVGIDLTEQVRISGGGRYEEVDKNNTIRECTTGIFDTTCLAAFIYPSDGNADNSYDLSFSAFQPSATIEYRPVPNLMTFFSYREGFKAGGFDFGRAVAGSTYEANIVFDEEDAKTFEFGAKGSLLDGAVTLTGTLFRTKVANLQVTALDPDPNALQIQTTNAGELRSQGIELEGTAALSSMLSVRTSISILDNEYLDFTGAECYVLQSASECVGGVQDLTGQTTPYAPSISGNVGYNFEYPVSDSLRLFSLGEVFFTSEYLTESDNDPNSLQDGFAKLDLTFGIGDADGHWSIAFVGRNLTDQLTAGRIFDSPGAAGSYAVLTDRPRTLGVQLTLRN